MPFLTQGKTNWKYILIVAVLAVIVGGGILFWIRTQEFPPVEFPKIKKPEKIIEKKNPELIEISMFPDFESFDFINKTFEGRIRMSDKKVKVITTDSTSFYRTAAPGWKKEYLTFSKIYSMVDDSVVWPLWIKGIFEKENVIRADEVFIIAQ